MSTFGLISLSLLYHFWQISCPAPGVGSDPLSPLNTDLAHSYFLLWTQSSNRNSSSSIDKVLSHWPSTDLGPGLAWNIWERGSDRFNPDIYCVYQLKTSSQTCCHPRTWEQGLCSGRQADVWSDWQMSMSTYLSAGTLTMSGGHNSNNFTLQSIWTSMKKRNQNNFF